MKKLVLVTVMSLGSLTAFAQEVVAEEVSTESISTEAVAEEVVAEEATEAVEATEEATEVVAEEAVEGQEGFNEVALEEVPEAITTALEAAHPGATISKAYTNESAQYKLEVATAEGETSELYADAEGNWIEM
ncbi:hypothetical protein [Aurantibacter sp.]|uniref:hypothetical protein n=1 Tax=Aurantibacter sp. TaxID=2807103 RepID=UPI0032663573